MTGPIVGRYRSSMSTGETNVETILRKMATTNAGSTPSMTNRESGRS